MTYSEQRDQIVDNIRIGLIHGTFTASYVAIGDNDYLTIKDIEDQSEFIISRFEVEGCLDCRVMVHRSLEGLRNEDGTFHICNKQ